MGLVAFEKYHGLGNDFLVMVDLDRSASFDDVMVKVLCDRHHGIGADGVLRLSSPARGATIKMELRNADGGVAETSGNGMRCAVLAAIHLGIAEEGDVLVETDAGLSCTTATLDGLHGAGQIRVEMGPVDVEEVQAVSGRRAFRVDAGNPHLVLLGEDFDGIDPAVLGPQLEASVPGGTNVEFVAPTHTPSVLDLITWERGAGLTLACGSGSCASAGAARVAGMVGLAVTVHNPGGSLLVELAEDDRLRAFLTGPAQRVGHVAVDLEDFTEVGTVRS